MARFHSGYATLEEEAASSEVSRIRPAYKYKRPISYDMFIQRVRRHGRARSSTRLRNSPLIKRSTGSHLRRNTPYALVFAEVIAEVPTSVIIRCLEWFSGDVDWFRDEVNLYRSEDEQLRRYDYNPLMSRPIVSIGASKFLAPVHPLVLRRMSPSSLYFMALPTLSPSHQEAFTNNIGNVFQEEYIGRQFAQIPGVELIPEVSFSSMRNPILDEAWQQLPLEAGGLGTS